MLNKLFVLGLIAGMTVRFNSVLATELPAWDFKDKDAKVWVASAHQFKSARVEEGVLKAVTSGKDPFFISPEFSLVPSAGQMVEFRAKCSAGGRGELFWLPKGARSFQQSLSVSFEWIGDGQWHDYRVWPYWQAEKQIRAFRLDFVNALSDEESFELSSIRIVNVNGEKHSGVPDWRGKALSAWRGVEGAKAVMKDDLLNLRFSNEKKGMLVSPNLSVDTYACGIIAVEMMARKEVSVAAQWACSSINGVHKRSFKIKPDGRFHTYNLDLHTDKNWRGDLLLLRLAFSDSNDDGAVAIRSIALSDEPQGPADISLLQARQVNAINRAGTLLPVYIQLENRGGKDARDLRLSVKSLPEGVSVPKDSSWKRVPELIAGENTTHSFTLETSTPVKGMAEFKLEGDGVDTLVIQLPLEILPDMKLPEADYAPQPIPLKSDYEIGALYFPGWSRMSAWARVWPVAPERKPVLGWYDEADPEVVDWQIKWAAENGISYFLLDWYWHKGYQHHDHWVKAFKKARYKSYLKFALMWANHNADGSHSIADQRKVTNFWLDNYFNMPEYYRIDDKPVVMIWSPRNMQRDVGEPDGCQQLLELSREMVRAAGYKGIHFIAMKWPEASTDPKVIQGLKDMGFDMTSLYHYMDHGGKAKNPRRYSFDLVADSSATFWKARHAADILPFLPNLSTGWDSRPWHGDKGIEIYGRTVEHFQRICNDAKKFADETGVKNMVLAPLNEWGEGSYAEPCAEFGFGMYEAVRNTFCEKPAEGWPLNYAPSDVGLGPYDLPMPKPDSMTEWKFKDGMQGWRVLMNINDASTSEKGLSFKSATRDPAICRTINHYRSKDFSGLVVRMKAPVGIKASCQLFWSRGETPTEATSLNLPLKNDGKFHDYVFEVAKKHTWRGRIGYLRFDPCNVKDAKMIVESIQLIPVSMNTKNDK